MNSNLQNEAAVNISPIGSARKRSLLTRLG
jgi:hypothetical protein